jgi:predicted ribosome quality control (RQC) complex YloA/Tae2 family protein
MLLTGVGMILGAAKHITDEINRYREVVPGIPYRQPPRQPGKLDPLSGYTGDDVPADLDEAARWLVDTYAGVSPLLAREAAFRASTGGDAPTRTSVAANLQMIVSGARAGVLSPMSLLDAEGQPEGAYPIRLLSVPESRQRAAESLNAALDAAWVAVDERDVLGRTRTALVAALHKAARRREREIEEVGAGLANAERADEYQQNADLIQANRARIVRGLSAVTVDDYYAAADGGGPAQRTIALDSTLDAGENADRYYKKARKARDSVAALTVRRARLQEEMATLRSATSEAERVETTAQVESIHERIASLLSRGERQTAGDPATPEVSRFEGHRIKTFRSVDGWEILVGENATSNDFLTTKVASPSDIWLHVRAATSAHGVIRSQNRPASVSPAALTLAAELVAARSEVKHSSLIPVDYTLKKYVRKPRKSAPGAVTYANEKTIYVNGIGS